MFVMVFLFWLTLAFAIQVVLGSFFEWALHRYLMHRKLSWFAYPFDRHALVHHRVFRSDDSYHLRRPQDRHTVPMAWWNGPVLILVAEIPYAVIAWVAGNPAVLLGSLLAASLYYGAYEYLHWCMHIPRARKVERSGIFFRLNGHHLLHHRYMNRNFNVVLPLADLLLGTLLRRSKVRFAQARGPAVPNVQPVERKCPPPTARRPARGRSGWRDLIITLWRWSGKVFVSDR